MTHRALPPVQYFPVYDLPESVTPEAEWDRLTREGPEQRPGTPGRKIRMSFVPEALKDGGTLPHCL